MRKVDRELDNPIDNLILDIGDVVVPWFKETGHTPNIITTYSFLCGLAAVYYLSQGDPKAFGIWFMLSYVFDCYDGLMARKYKMTSAFGDMYDHITDIVVICLVGFIVIKNYKAKLTWPIILLSLSIGYLTQMHIGCYQKHFIESQRSENGGESLDLLTKLCVDKNKIKLTRYFGPGTAVVFFILLICYLHYY